jgi:hypothetical protein
MATTARGGDGLVWRVRRLWFPPSLRPPTMGDALQIQPDERVRAVLVHGRRRPVPATQAQLWPAAFAVAALTLPLMPLILLLRLLRLTCWTVEASTRPWGRRGPRRVMRWQVRGWSESSAALRQIADALESGQRVPAVPGAERLAPET